MWELPLDGGEATQVTFGEGPDISPDISPDGQLLTFNVDVTTMPLFAYSRPGARRVTPGRVHLRDLHVTPDGREVVAASVDDDGWHVVVVTIATGAVRRLAEGRRPALTPDGAAVVFDVEGTPDHLDVISLAGGLARRVTELTHPVRAVAVGDDGLVHLELDDAGVPSAWRVPLAGGALERDGDANDIFVVPAPRGGWSVRFTREPATAALIPPGAVLDDARIQRLTTEQVSWSADGASLAYWDGHGLRRRSVATGADVTFAEPGDVVGVALSPDGETLYTTEITGHVRRYVISNFGDRPRP